MAEPSPPRARGGGPTATVKSAPVVSRFCRLVVQVCCVVAAVCGAAALFLDGRLLETASAWDSHRPPPSSSSASGQAAFALDSGDLEGFPEDQRAGGSGSDSALSFPLPRRVQATEANEPKPFLLLGTGECLAVAFRPMRGRSRRDLGHAACRSSCQDDHCVGYSYSPCQRVCTVHGDPTLLNGVPSSEGWTTMNGGGRIVQTTGQCGTNCYVRMGPCPAGTVMSSGAPVQYGEVPFGKDDDVQCPNPWAGVLTLSCGLAGITVTSGRCARPCLPGSLLERSFEVPYPPILHGQEVLAPCPAGTQGALLLRCVDETIHHMEGRCGYNCPRGAIRAGEATVQYPNMIHDQLLDLPCPEGYGGEVTVECVDSLVTRVGGRCDAHCDPGIVPMQVGNITAYAEHGPILHGQVIVRPCLPLGDVVGSIELLCRSGFVYTLYNATLGGCRQHCPAGVIGTGAKALSHGTLEHGFVHVLQCMQGSTGNVTVRCDDGQVEVLHGSCKFHCHNGTVTSNSVTLAHDFVYHGSNVSIDCPNVTHTGVLVASCNDGAMLYNGTCGGNCFAGSITSNGATVYYPFIRHKTEVTIECTYPWGSNVTIRCYDTLLYISGSCGHKCDASETIMGSAVVRYDGLNHSESRNYSCVSRFVNSPLTFSGQVEVTCFDGQVLFGGTCWPDCSAGSFLNRNVRVYHGHMLADTSTNLTCEPDSTYGTVEVTCRRGLVEVDAGSCGAPCPEDYYNSPMTRWIDLLHEEVTHNREIVKNCPNQEQLSGTIRLTCFDGQMKAEEGNCGERCSPGVHSVYGAVFNSPAMEHGALYMQPCMETFSGFVNVSCAYGRVNATSECLRGCFAANITLDSGAVVFTPQMSVYDTVDLPCPSMFVGSVTVECMVGLPRVVQGACNRGCVAGRYQPTPDSPWDIPYLEFEHGETVEKQCPEDMSGSVFLTCDRGVVTNSSGGCYKNCLAGRAVIRQGIVMRYAAVNHGTLLPSMQCPAGFVGSVRLRCLDGEIALGEGECNAHCPAGLVQGAPFGFLLHNENASLVCPIAGTIGVTCFDGVARAVEGQCAEHCEAGDVYDSEDNVNVAHGAVDHNTNSSGTCMGFTVGHKNVRCEYGQVQVLPLPGERCYRHCVEQEAVTPDGTRMLFPQLNHLQRVGMSCPNGVLGSVVARCFDSTISVVEGECGHMNCDVGSVTSGGVMVTHGTMNNGRRGGPSDCPLPNVGEAVFECRNGTAAVVDVTYWYPPIEGMDAEVDSTVTATSTTTTTVTTTPGRHTGPPVLTDSWRFLLCSCCEPARAPPDAEPVDGVDYRTIVYWAVGVGGGGLLLAAIAGGWLLRPQSCCKKASRVTPTEKGNSPKAVTGTPMALTYHSKQEVLALENQLAALDQQKRLYTDMQDEKALQMVTLREAQIQAELSSSIVPGTATGLRGALALENSPQAPPTGPTQVAQATVNLQELDAPSQKKVRGYREGYDGEWRHW